MVFRVRRSVLTAQKIKSLLYVLCNMSTHGLLCFSQHTLISHTLVEEKHWRKHLICQIWGYPSGLSEDSRLLGYHAVALGD